MFQFFPNDTYDTDPATPRRFMDRLFLGSRWYFAVGYYLEILRSRGVAIKNLYNDEAWTQSSYRIVKLIEGCGGRLHLSGIGNIRSLKDPVVFISNHMSMLETFVFPSIIAPLMPVTYVVKESLVKHSAFGPVMRSRNPIVVLRKNAREDLTIVVKKGTRATSFRNIDHHLSPEHAFRNIRPQVFQHLGNHPGQEKPEFK